jgi:hypothetical protein
MGDESLGSVLRACAAIERRGSCAEEPAVGSCAGEQLSIINYQLSIINYQLSITPQQQPTNNK